MNEIVTLKIITNARRNEIVGRMADGTIKIRVKAKPISGKANATLINFLSEKFDVPQEQIKIISGAHSSRKTVQIVGIHYPIDWD